MGTRILGHLERQRGGLEKTGVGRSLSSPGTPKCRCSGGRWSPGLGERQILWRHPCVFGDEGGRHG